MLLLIAAFYSGFKLSQIKLHLMLAGGLSSIGMACPSQFLENIYNFFKSYCSKTHFTFPPNPEP